MSSGYIPAKDEPKPEEILDALREDFLGKPHLTQIPAEEVARQLVLGGHLQQEETSPALVANYPLVERRPRDGATVTEAAV